MNKSLYLFSIVISLGLIFYLYFINFDNMSETELVNSVLYWYIPLVFGMYGLTALRLKKNATEDDTSVVKKLFQSQDNSMTALAITILLLGGIIGIVLFFLPLSIFKEKSKNFDISVAIFGTILWLVALFGFFVLLWPSL